MIHTYFIRPLLRAYVFLLKHLVIFSETVYPFRSDASVLFFNKLRKHLVYFKYDQDL